MCLLEQGPRTDTISVLSGAGDEILDETLAQLRGAEWDGIRSYRIAPKVR
jgi:hypothetical protein